MSLKRLKPGDIIIVAAVIIISAALFSLSFLINQTTDKLFVEIYLDSELRITLPIDSDTDFTVCDGVVVSVRNRSVYMKESDCPDKLCVRQGEINKAGQMIVCVPNRVVVIIGSASGQKEEVDAVA